MAELVGLRPEPAPPAITPVLAELRALDAISSALAPLDKAARGRVLTWARGRFLCDALDALEAHLRESCDPGRGGPARG